MPITHERYLYEHITPNTILEPWDMTHDIERK